VTRLYIARGYVSSGARLDDSRLAEGVLQVRVIEGRIDQWRMQGLDRLSPAYVQARLARDGEPLDVNRLQERFQLQLADPLFSRLNLPACCPTPARPRGAGRRGHALARPWQA
jgi:hemolysin activation/secretion protein